MIIDSYTHIWTTPDQLGEQAKVLLARHGLSIASAYPAAHVQAAQCVDVSLVAGFRSQRLNMTVPNESIAEHVAAHPGRCIGIAVIDPTEPHMLSIAKELLERDEFRALAICPAAQGFHPSDSRAMKLYAMAEQRGTPIFIQNGLWHPQSVLAHARPLLWDEVAREFPALTLVLPGIGDPWIDECLTLLGKHPRVFAHLAGLSRHPWKLYNTLVLANETGLTEKLLLASGFPYATPSQVIETVYRTYEMTQGTPLPGIPRELLRRIVERPTLKVLGMARPGDAPGKAEEEH